MKTEYRRELAKTIRETHENVNDIFKLPWAEGVRAACKSIALTQRDKLSWDDEDYTSDDFLRDCGVNR